jgi:carbohydrate-binding DOMON domain-containing protein
MGTGLRLLAFVLALITAGGAQAQTVIFKDPSGDDRGPGRYSYPTDPVYVPGAFDLTELRVEVKGDWVEVSVEVAATLSNPWDLPFGLSLQFPVVLLGAKEIMDQRDLPGMNATFGFPGWDRAVLISPLPPAQVGRHVSEFRGLDRDVVISPTRARIEGRRIIATVRRSELPAGDPAFWGYQVIMMKHDAFPTPGYLLTRGVNESAGFHVFGGGDDGHCDPSIIDMLAGEGHGEAEEIEAQYQVLSDYECDASGEPLQFANIPMVFLR